MLTLYKALQGYADVLTDRSSFGSSYLVIYLVVHEVNFAHSLARCVPFFSHLTEVIIQGKKKKLKLRIQEVTYILLPKDLIGLDRLISM